MLDAGDGIIDGLSVTAHDATEDELEPKGLIFESPSVDGEPVDKNSAHRVAVKYSPPFKRCETCGRKTGWRSQFDEGQWHTCCQYCAKGRVARLIINIIALNDHSVIAGMES